MPYNLQLLPSHKVVLAALGVMVLGEFFVAYISDTASNHALLAREIPSSAIERDTPLVPEKADVPANECFVGACGPMFPEQLLPIIHESTLSAGCTPSGLTFSPTSTQSPAAGSSETFNVQFSMNGSYASIRETVGALLSHHANFALDDIQLTRPDASSTTMKADLTLSVFLPASY